MKAMVCIGVDPESLEGAVGGQAFVSDLQLHNVMYWELVTFVQEFGIIYYMFRMIKMK